MKNHRAFSRRAFAKGLGILSFSPWATGTAVAAQVGLGGFDSTAPVLTESLVLQATAALAGMPLFCGRYFSATSPSNTICSPSDVALLGRHQIPILPIARQTRRVGSENSDDGYSDAMKNVAEFLRVYRATSRGTQIVKRVAADQSAGKMRPIMFFLDCEGEPSISRLYYMGWVNGLLAAGKQYGILFSPAVYLPANDQKSADAIDQVMDTIPSACEGLWVAKYPFGAQHRSFGCRPYANLGQPEPYITISSRAPVLLHQYTECDDLLDLSRLINSIDPINFFDKLAATWVPVQRI